MGKVVLPKGAAAPVLGVTPDPQGTAVKASRPADSPEAADEPDLRLMIEESEEAGGYVYVIVDRKTGKVVRRLSREEVLRLREKSNYAAGAVFDGKA
jgi:uncharacterized FlaG/YvyC family protein